MMIKGGKEETFFTQSLFYTRNFHVFYFTWVF